MTIQSVDVNLPTIQSGDETSRQSNQWMKPPENPISG